MTDLLCLDDVDLYATELDDPIAELEQDLYHRLLEDPGENLDDPDRGCGLRQSLNGPIVVSELQKRVENDFKKDERVDDAKATVEDLGTGHFRLRVEVTASGQKLGITVDNLTADGTIRRVT